MFNNIGSKVKGLAVFFCVFGMIGSLAGAIVLWTNDLIAAGFGTLIGGCLSAWVGSWVMYCIGDTNVRIAEMQEKLKESPAHEKKEPVRSKPHTIGGTVKAIHISDTKEQCSNCGAELKAGCKTCWNCGAELYRYD
ncbi:MAG: zinc ribbon domain-containing protein [Clostridia bacterium]|nr:zinc ribbon domain-containing protein [Clostridia bacterium]